MDKKQLTLAELAELIGGEFVGDKDLVITGFSSVEQAKEGEVTFFIKVKNNELSTQTKASVAMVPLSVESADISIVRVKDPYLASAKVHLFFLEADFCAKGIHDRAFVGENCKIAEEVTVEPNATICDGAKIGARTTIESGVVVGENVTIGEDCIMKANVTIYDGCTLGNKVIIHSGTIIGSDGFGYATDHLGNHFKRPHVGTVIIGDAVEIGSNCCIDRATFGNTEIGSGSKLDNLIQIGHNVIIGENTIIVAGVAIGGSATLGRNVVIGGHATIKGHIKLDDGVMIAARGGVHTNLAKGSVVGGVPAIPIKQWGKASAVFSKLPDMRTEVRALRKEIEELKNK